MRLPRPPPSARYYLLAPPVVPVLPVLPVLLDGLVVLDGLVLLDDPELDGVVLLELPLPDVSVELEPVEEPVIELPLPDVSEVPDVLLSVPVVPEPDEPLDEP